MDSRDGTSMSPSDAPVAWEKTGYLDVNERVSRDVILRPPDFISSRNNHWLIRKDYTGVNRVKLSSQLCHGCVFAQPSSAASTTALRTGLAGEFRRAG